MREPSLLSNLKDRAIRGLMAWTGSQRVLTAQLDITNACNLACTHCYHAHHSNAAALDLGGWRRVLDQYESLRRKLYLGPRFVICGGEPTLSPLFFPILGELEARWPGVRIVVLTNGSKLTPGFVRRLVPFNVGFQISLDGPDQARHDLIRGHGSFQAAGAAIASLQAAGRDASLLATLSHRTAPWVDAFFAAAARLGAEEMNFTRFISQGTGRKLEDGRLDRPLTGPELKSAYLAIRAASIRAGLPTNTNLPLYHLVDDTLGANGKVGFQGVVIDYQGNLKVSSRTDFRLGNVLEHGLEELFLRHPLMRKLRDGAIDGCGGCAHYARCGGDRNASFAATGSFLKKDPACWLDAAPKEVAWSH